MLSYVLIIVLVLVLVGLFFVGRPSKTKKAQQKREDEVVAQLTGIHEKESGRWWFDPYQRTVMMTWLFVIGLAITIFIVVRKYSPHLIENVIDTADKPELGWFLLLAIVLFVTAVWFIIFLIEHILLMSQPAKHKNSSSTKYRLLRGGIIVLIFSFPSFVALMQFWISTWLTETSNTPWFPWYLVFFGFVAMMLPMFGDTIVTKWVFAPVKRGDYKTGLNRVHTLRHIDPKNMNHRMKEGMILLDADQLTDAESLLCEVTANGKAMTRYAAWESWGYALLYQGFYDKAERVLFAFIENVTERQHAHGTLAGVYLWQGIEYQKALQLSEQSIESITLMVGKNHQAKLWGIHAWALATNRRYFDAEEAVTKMFELGSKRNVPSWAEINIYAGKVMQLRGDRMQAKQYFEKAIIVDKEGIYGRLARKALNDLEKS